MADIDRKLVVFVHIFKNSGTSINYQLKHFFGPKGFRHENDGIVGNARFQDRIRGAALADQVKALSGHFTFYRVSLALKEAGVTNARFFSFVREPVGRVVSIYNYSRNLDKSRHHAIARDNDLDGFIQTFMSDFPKLISNHQTAALSHDTTRTFAAAKQTISDHFAFVGLANDIAATNPVSLANFGIAFDGTVRRNVSESTAKVSDISPGLLRKLQDLNQEDQRLYDHVHASVHSSADRSDQPKMTG